MFPKDPSGIRLSDIRRSLNNLCFAVEYFFLFIDRILLHSWENLGCFQERVDTSPLYSGQERCGVMGASESYGRQIIIGIPRSSFGRGWHYDRFFCIAALRKCAVHLKKI